jgi:hypothetical protein
MLLFFLGNKSVESYFNFVVQGVEALAAKQSNAHAFTWAFCFNFPAATLRLFELQDC